MYTSRPRLENPLPFLLSSLVDPLDKDHCLLCIAGRETGDKQQCWTSLRFFISNIAILGSIGNQNQKKLFSLFSSKERLVTSTARRRLRRDDVFLGALNERLCKTGIAFMISVSLSSSAEESTEREATIWPSSSKLPAIK